MNRHWTYSLRTLFVVTTICAVATFALPKLPAWVYAIMIVATIAALPWKGFKRRGRVPSARAIRDRPNDLLEDSPRN